MPRSYWRVVLAVVGCLTLANSQPEQNAGQTKAGTQEKITKTAPAPAAGPSLNPVYSSKYKPPCAEPQDHNRCDLEAQWKAANASRDAADWAWWQMLLSTAGIAGLIYSLILTRRATRVAVEASQDADKAILVAERNADAAALAVEATKEANEISRAQFEASNRPWLSFRVGPYYIDEAVHPLNMFKENDPPRWTRINNVVHVTNVGNAPAIIESIWLGVFNSSDIQIDGWPEQKVWIELAPREASFLYNHMDHGAVTEADAAGNPLAHFGSFHLTAENRDEFFSNYPAIGGWVVYSDPLGNRRKTGFAFRPASAWSKDLIRFGGHEYNYDKKFD